MQKRLYCNPAACSYENGKYVGSIIGDSNVTKLQKKQKVFQRKSF